MRQTEGNKLLATIEDLLNNTMGYPAGTLALKDVLEIHGGVEIYIPTATERYIALRNEQIKNEFKGDNHADLAGKYKLHEVHIRRIIRGG